MSDSAAATGHRLEIRRTFQAPRERVYRAFTDPAEVKKWFHAGDNYTTPLAEIDLKVGGAYRWRMRSEDAGVDHTACGVYREINAPEKIVFTLDWEGEGDKMGVETLVTVKFLDKGDATEVILTHELLPNEDKRNAHEHGWIACLGQLEKLAQS